MLGPLARASEPHSYDLCAEHSAGMTVPRGWRVIRVPGTADASDELVALADAVRPRPAATTPPQPVRSAPAQGASTQSGSAQGVREGAPRRLQVVRSPHE